MIQAGGREGGGYGAIDEPCVATPRRCRVSGSVARFIGASVAILAAIISCKPSSHASPSIATAQL